MTVATGFVVATVAKIVVVCGLVSSGGEVSSPSAVPCIVDDAVAVVVEDVVVATVAETLVVRGLVPSGGDLSGSSVVPLGLENAVVAANNVVEIAAVTLRVPRVDAAGVLAGVDGAALGVVDSIRSNMEYRLCWTVWFLTLLGNSPLIDDNLQAFLDLQNEKDRQPSLARHCCAQPPMLPTAVAMSMRFWVIPIPAFVNESPHPGLALVAKGGLNVVALGLVAALLVERAVLCALVSVPVGGAVAAVTSALGSIVLTLEGGGVVASLWPSPVVRYSPSSSSPYPDPDPERSGPDPEPDNVASSVVTTVAAMEDG